MGQPRKSATAARAARDDHRTAYLEHPERPQDQRRARRDGAALHRPADQHFKGRAVCSGLSEDQPEQPHSGDRRSRGAGRRPDQHLRVGGDPGLSRREDRQVLAEGRPAPAGAGAGVADVADGRFRPDAGAGAPFPAGQGRDRPALRPRALHQGNPPALRRLRQAPRRGRVRRRQ